MDKKWLAIGLILVLAGGGGGVLFLKNKKVETVAPLPVNVGTSEKSQNMSLEGNELFVDVGSRKTSMIDLNLSGKNIADKGFELNKAVFNSEMLNKIEGDSWRMVLGIMKPTAELPSGKISVGKFLKKVDKLMLVEGSVTLIATDTDPVVEVPMVGGEVVGK